MVASIIPTCPSPAPNWTNIVFESEKIGPIALAPKIVQEMFDIMKMMASEAITILLVEQNALMGLKNSDWGVVLDLGRTLFEGPSEEVLTDPRIQELYLGGKKAA